jgi:hypothetical protein
MPMSLPSCLALSVCQPTHHRIVAGLTAEPIETARAPTSLRATKG